MKGTNVKMQKAERKITRKTKSNRGITLIALVITVVILIILATVTLNVVLGEGGLIDRAQQAKDLTEQAALEEQQGLNSLMSEMANIMEEEKTPQPPTPIGEAKPNPNEDGLKFENTTTVTDDLDNEVTIPGGFHLDKDSGTKVEEGIVIEDESGNQFVWIPVGEYNVTEEIEKITEPDTQDGKLTNELSRRQWADENVVEKPTLVNGDEAIAGPWYESYKDSYYGEGNSLSVAKNQIAAFKTSAINNKGFYVGRYEAGTEKDRNGGESSFETPLVQANKYPYGYIIRDQAKTQAEVMYSGNEFITSELISSYAWDTTLNFICQTNEEGYLLSTTTDKKYANIGTRNKTKTGEYSADSYSKIHDFLGNCDEWTTEYSDYYNENYSFECVPRGGSYYDGLYPAFRGHNRNTVDSTTYFYSFRIQLYINPAN